MTATRVSIDPWVGLVFEAAHLGTGAIFAAKILRPGSDPDAAVDFADEGALLRRLQSCSGVINIVDGGTASIDVSVGGTTVRMMRLVLTR